MSEIQVPGDPVIMQMRELLPFLYAARRGLERSRWKPGMPVDDLLAPITLAILVEVSRRVEIK